MTKHDLTNERFGHLLVLHKAEKPKDVEIGKYTYWKCICDCGNEVVKSRKSLKEGMISCGCIKKPWRKEIKPRKPYKKRDIVPLNDSERRFRRTWQGMKNRCYRTNHNEYHNYGAKGIIICDKWLTFSNFECDMYKLYLEFEEVNGEKSATIDRINPKGNYEPHNCRWATQLEQARNRSNNISVEIEGVLYNTISEVSEAYEISYQTILQRHNRGLVGLALVDKSNLRKPNMIKYTNGRIVYKVSE